MQVWILGRGLRFWWFKTIRKQSTWSSCSDKVQARHTFRAWWLLGMEWGKETGLCEIYQYLHVISFGRLAWQWSSCASETRYGVTCTTDVYIFKSLFGVYCVAVIEDVMQLFAVFSFSFVGCWEGDRWCVSFVLRLSSCRLCSHRQIHTAKVPLVYKCEIVVTMYLLIVVTVINETKGHVQCDGWHSNVRIDYVTGIKWSPFTSSCTKCLWT